MRVEVTDWHYLPLSGGNRSFRPWEPRSTKIVNGHRGRQSVGGAHRPHPSAGRSHGLNERLPAAEHARDGELLIPQR